VQCNADGQLALKLKTPWSDCTTHLVTSLLHVTQRLLAQMLQPAFASQQVSRCVERMAASGRAILGSECQQRVGSESSMP
jgi:hypothetical protein